MIYSVPNDAQICVQAHINVAYIIIIVRYRVQYGVPSVSKIVSNGVFISFVYINMTVMYLNICLIYIHRADIVYST